MQPATRATCVFLRISSCSGSVAIGFTLCWSSSVNTFQSVFREASIIILTRPGLHTPSSASTQPRPRASSGEDSRSSCPNSCPNGIVCVNSTVLASVCRQNKKSGCPLCVRYASNSQNYSPVRKSSTISSASTVPIYVHCQGQGKQACRVWCKGQQHTNRRHIIHRTPQL